MLDLPWPDLKSYLAQTLAAPGHQTDEHSLMKGFLQQHDLQLDLLQPLSLFKMHFCLRHYLYQLDLEWRRQGQPGVELGLLEIRRDLCLPTNTCQTGSQELQQAHPLASYYLQAKHLHQEDEDSLIALLKHSWQRLQAQDPKAKAQALAVLHLSEPLCQLALKKQFRRLAQQQHPDRGGDEQQFRRLRQAYELLRQG